MDYPYFDNDGGDLTVTVDLQHTSDVQLLDQNNFNIMQSGGSYQYFGGTYDRTPVHVTVSGPGRWYLVVGNGSGEQYSYRWSK